MEIEERAKINKSLDALDKKLSEKLEKRKELFLYTEREIMNINNLINNLKKV